VAAQHRGAATSILRQGGREVFGVGSDRRSDSEDGADKGEVFAVAWRDYSQRFGFALM
jgi:hypothetical protein